MDHQSENKSSLAQAIEKLKASSLRYVHGEYPSEVPFEDIKLMPGVFQPRVGEDPGYVEELRSRIRHVGELDPILVIDAGGNPVVIDGHHRMAAYREAQWKKALKVEWFKGSIEEAVLKAGELNSKLKLSMFQADRMDYAWRLTLLGTHSKKIIATHAGVSEPQVSIMRKVMRDLGEDAVIHGSWREALRATKDSTDMDEDEREAWKENLARSYADRLRKTFGKQLTKNLEVTAMALEIHLGRRFEELARELRNWFPKEEDEESDF